jgi:hypothetical protein
VGSDFLPILKVSDSNLDLETGYSEAKFKLLSTLHAKSMGADEIHRELCAVKCKDKVIPIRGHECP